MRANCALLAFALCAAAGCTSETYDPMERQPKFKPYSENDFFLDNRAMRQPPDGTVSREQARGDRQLVMGLQSDSKPVAELPIQLTRELLERGRNRFDIYCAACHGQLGDGKSIVARNMNLRPPPSLHETAIRSKSVGHYYRVITEGYGLMAPYSSELDLRDRWAVVAYVRALQRSQGARLDDVPASVRGQLDKEGAR